MIFIMVMCCCYAVIRLLFCFVVLLLLWCYYSHVWLCWKGVEEAKPLPEQQSKINHIMYAMLESVSIVLFLLIMWLLLMLLLLLFSLLLLFFLQLFLIIIVVLCTTTCFACLSWFHSSISFGVVIFCFVSCCNMNSQSSRVTIATPAVQNSETGRTRPKLEFFGCPNILNMISRNPDFSRVSGSSKRVQKWPFRS